MLNSSTAQAYAVVSIVAHIMGEQFDKKVRIDPVVNGREQGLKIWSDFRYHCAVYGDRHTDSIMVMYGDSADFSPQGNGPISDNVYRTKTRCFGDDFELAAQWVYDYISGKNPQLLEKDS